MLSNKPMVSIDELEIVRMQLKTNSKRLQSVPIYVQHMQSHICAGLQYKTRCSIALD